MAWCWSPARRAAARRPHYILHWNLIKSVHRNIVTVEDPVEYQLELINQVQASGSRNMTFANALRSILRQDPDVIMVGEIRDAETAEVAIQAALTGHLVLSVRFIRMTPVAPLQGCSTWVSTASRSQRRWSA